MVVEYLYDSWGKLESITGSLASTIGIKNPLRYRGYYYDIETRLYYLQSRYYDPETGRFISMDAYFVAGDYLQGTNMYSYCLNNPIVYSDYTGYSTQKILGIGISAIFVVAACAQELANMIGEEQALEVLEQLVSDGSDIYDLMDFVGFTADALGLGGTAIGVVANSYSKLINSGGGIWQYQSTMPKSATVAKGIGVATTTVGALLTGIDIYNLWVNRDDLTTEQKIAGTAINVGGFAASNAVGAAAGAAGSFIAASGPFLIGTIPIPGGIVGAAVAVTLGAAGAFLITFATQELNKKVGI